MQDNEIMHRDIRPKNIIFKRVISTDELTIIDFSLATKYKLEKFQLLKCGTPGYIAPEIANL